MKVPINPAVLGWAISRAGLRPADVATRLSVDESLVDDWLARRSRPNKGQVDQLAQLLGRQFAFFLSSHPPHEEDAAPDFRRTSRDRDRIVEAGEREAVRRVRFRQATAMQVLADEQVSPTFETIREAMRSRLSHDPEARALKARQLFAAPEPTQYRRIPSDGAALYWARLLESRGLFVFKMKLGEESAEGISVYHESAPAIVLNSSIRWAAGRLVFTLMHEVGHVALRSASVCESTSPTTAADNVEAWCNKFAAAFLMPRDGLRAVLDSTAQGWNHSTVTLDDVRAVAEQLRVSIKATAIRLAALGWLRQEVAEQAMDLPWRARPVDPSEEIRIPAYQLRLSQFGRGYVRLMLSAHARGVLDTPRTASILNLEVGQIPKLRARVMNDG